MVEVAPLTALKLDPELVETSHWTLGVGDPDAAALNEAVEPALTVSLAGFRVIFGALGGADTTVRVAGLVVALPARFEKTASYSYPFSDADAVNV